MALYHNSQRVEYHLGSRTARIWDLDSGNSVATLQGHESAVHKVSLSPATRRIATIGRDGTIRIWDLSSRKK